MPRAVPKSAAPAVKPATPQSLPGWLPRTGRATFLLDLALLLALALAVCGPYLVRAWQTALPGGWDGMPHYAIADLYARRLFPALSGWMPEYFGGMPYPTFYPPVFYMGVAALTKVGLSTHNAFMGVQTVASLAVPLLTYLCGRRLCASRVAGLVAGALAVGLMVDHNPLWRMGITLSSTFDAGLSTQLLSHCVLLLFYWALLAAEESVPRAGLAALFFGLVPLTNVHMVWAAAFLFVPLVVARLVAAPSRAARVRVLARYTAIGAAAVLLTLAWALPMLAYIRFVPTLALEALPPGVVAFTFLRLGGYLLFGLVAALTLRDGRGLALAAGLLLLLAFTALPMVRWLGLGDLALQPARVVIPFPFLTTLLVGYLVSVAREATGWRHAQLAAGGFCAFVFFSHFRMEQEPVGNVSAAQLAGYDNVLRALGGRADGRVLVEMGTDGISDPFSLQALVGSSGAHSLTTVFRESALNVLFAVPLRNSFSFLPETFGVDHKLAPDELADDTVEQHLARLRLFNVRYFAAQAQQTKARLASLPGVSRQSPEGPWELYAFDAPAAGYATVPAYAPVLTFARFSVKPRPEYGFDFVRLGEELFSAGRLDTPLVLSRCERLDACEDWERFQTALVTDYRYEDRARAFDAIERFSRERHVVLLASADPLYAELAALAGERKTLHLVEHAPPPETAEAAFQREAVRQVLGQVFDVLDGVRVPLKGVPGVSRATLEGGQVTVELDAEPSREVPLWIRQGYFPGWVSSGGAPVYMATPTFQLTFVRQRTTELRFEGTRAEWVGGGLGLLGCLAIGVALAWRRRPDGGAPV